METNIYHFHWHWFTDIQLLKKGEGVFYWRPQCSLDFYFLVLNKLVIDCVSGYVTALLNLVAGFCVDLAPCWSRQCQVHAWRNHLLARGGRSEDLWPLGLFLRQCGHVFANSVRSCGKKAPGKSPRGQGTTGAPWLGPGWDNLASCSLFGLDIWAISLKRTRHVC